MTRGRPNSGRRARWAVGVTAIAAIAACTAGPVAGTAGVAVAAPGTAASPAREWTLVAEDNFSTASLAPFTAYTGVPGCCSGTRWDPAQTRVRGGSLVLNTSRNAAGVWVSGGAGGYSWPAGTREYGKWEARVRFDRGFGVWAALLLWPANDIWPPEVDFYEVFPTDTARRNLVATAHYTAANRLLSSSRRGSFTGWHTVGVEWTADRLAYVLDGRVWSVTTDRAVIPHQPMWLGIQTTLGTCPQACPDASTPPDVSLQVDWVKVYAPAGATAPPATSAPASSAPATSAPATSAPAPSAPATSAPAGPTPTTPVPTAPGASAVSAPPISAGSGPGGATTGAADGASRPPAARGGSGSTGPLIWGGLAVVLGALAGLGWWRRRRRADPPKPPSAPTPPSSPAPPSPPASPSPPPPPRHLSS